MPNPPARPIPQNLEAERAVLASMLLAPQTIPKVRGILNDGDAFHSAGHRKVYRAIAALADRSMPADLITVTDELAKRGDLDAIGGASFVQSVMDSVPSTANAEFHAALIREKAHARRIIEDASRSIDLAYAGEKDPLEIAEKLSMTLEAIRATAPGATPKPLDLAAMAEKGIEPIPWLLPGWLTADDIFMIAGAPYGGKSTFAYDLADAIARGRPCCGITPSTSARVLVIDEEQGPRAAGRLAVRLAMPYRGPHANLLVYSMEGFRLNSRRGAARLEAVIKDFAPIVVVLDSVQLIFGCENENDAAEVSRVYAELFRLRDAYHLSFLLVHHKRKTQGPVDQAVIELVRGSSVHGAACSAIAYMVRNGDGSADLRLIKRREARLLSIRIGYADDGEDGAILLTNLGSIDQAESESERVISWIVGFVGDRGEVRTCEIESAAKAEGFQRRTVLRAAATLVKAGVLEKPRRGVYRLGRGTNPEVGTNLSLTGTTGSGPRRPESSEGARQGAPRSLDWVGTSLSQGGAS